MDGGDDEEVFVTAIAAEELVLSSVAFEVESQGAGVVGFEFVFYPVGGEGQVGGVDELFHGFFTGSTGLTG